MKISLGGIKFSEELVHITHRAQSPADRSFVDLIEWIGKTRINMPFICTGAIGDEMYSTFCIASTDFTILERFLASQPQPLVVSEQGCPKSSAAPPLGDQLQIIHRVGTMTLFPHRRSLAILGHLVEILGQAGIAIHSLCTSISAIAINIDYDLLDRAVEALGKIVELPENHAPFRPEFSVRQVAL